jgi:hypothetical protein
MTAYCDTVVGYSTNLCGSGSYVPAAQSNVYAFSVTLGGQGTAYKYGLFAQTGGIQVKMGLYTDSGGQPGSLVDYSDELTTVTNTAVETSSALCCSSILPSGKYWLAFVAKSDVDVCTDARQVPIDSAAATYSTGLPQQFPAGFIQSQGLLNAYLVLIN